MVLLTGCELFSESHSPKGYALPRPEIHFLHKKLNEISGIFFLDEENSMLAIADDKRRVYRIYTDGREDDYFDPDLPVADYEDVLKAGSSVFALVSNGRLVELQRSDSGLTQKVYALFGRPVDEKNIEEEDRDIDFETMYHDPDARSIILICKNCKGESKQGIRTAYRFRLDTRSFDPEPFYTIGFRDVNERLKDGQVEFKPSAAAIHPIEKRLYILSSAGFLLVVTDLRGQVEEAYRLNPSFYPQAEGIAFAKNGDMYISNEAKLGKPTLLRIPYRRSSGRKSR